MLLSIDNYFDVDFYPLAELDQRPDMGVSAHRDDLQSANGVREVPITTAAVSV